MEKPEEATLRRLYVDEQKSLADIGRIYGKHAAQIHRWFLSYDIPRRDARTSTMLSGKYGVQNEAHREILRKNIAKARACITEEGRRKPKTLGREPWNKGKPMPEAQRQLLIAQRADPEYRARMSEMHSGERSYNWKGGAKPEHMRSLDRAEWRRTRQLVYERDNWTCQECGCRCLSTRDAKAHPKRKIQAHHRIPRRYGGSDELGNLVTLCMSCHHKTERKYERERGET